jgi:HlyD family secretion protein
MKPNFSLRNVLIGILAIALLGATAWGIVAYLQSKNSGSSALAASGFVESAKIEIAPELSGKVLSVSASEGQTVKKGAEMLRLDDSLLQAQRAVVAAGVDQAEAAVRAADAAVQSAQTQLQAALDGARQGQQPGRTADWLEPAPAGYDLPMWYFTQAERLKALQAELITAQADLDRAKEDLQNVEQQSASRDFMAAEDNLARAVEAYRVAQTLLDRANQSTDGLALKAEAQRLYDKAAADLKDALDKYHQALLTDGAQNVLNARARLTMAQERVDTLLDQIRTLQTGALSPQVAAAQDLVAQAQAAADQAHAAARGASANLALIDVEIAKTIVTAPVDGVVFTRAVEPGTIISAGSVVFTIGDLNRLTITVYVPETRIGEVAVGMPATVTVDSYPGETFQATVTYISDTAEFTPRNVQTVEGRKATVFAVKLTLVDNHGELKPGMPADVTFKGK